MDTDTYMKVMMISKAAWQRAMDDLAQQAKPFPANLKLVRMVYDDPKAPRDMSRAAYRALVAMERNRSQPKGTVAGIPERKRTAAQACKDHADDIGRLLDMIGQAVNQKAAEPTWPVAGTLAWTRSALIDILVHVGDLDPTAIRETLAEMRADCADAKGGGA